MFPYYSVIFVFVVVESATRNRSLIPLRRISSHRSHLQIMLNRWIRFNSHYDSASFFMTTADIGHSCCLVLIRLSQFERRNMEWGFTSGTKVFHTSCKPILRDEVGPPEDEGNPMAFCNTSSYFVIRLFLGLISSSFPLFLLVGASKQGQWSVNEGSDSSAYIHDPLWRVKL